MSKDLDKKKKKIAGKMGSDMYRQMEKMKDDDDHGTYQVHRKNKRENIGAVETKGTWKPKWAR